MKILLTFFVLLFSSSVVADDVSDFEIEGMSLGNSLLDYFSEEEINHERKTVKLADNEYFQRVQFYKSDFLRTYDGITLSYKKKENYKIYTITGNIYYRYNISDCYEKKNLIVNELKNLFVNVKTNNDVKSHRGDSSGKSKINMFTFQLKNGEQIQVSCNDWSKEKESENYWDQLKVVILSLDYMEYLENKYEK